MDKLDEVEFTLAAQWKRQQAATAEAVRQASIDRELDRLDEPYQPAPSFWPW